MLSKSGELSETTDYRVEKPEVVITNDKPYAEIHNEGFDGDEDVPEHERKNKKTEGTHTVKAHKRHMIMPQRQFISDMPELETNINAIVERDMALFVEVKI